MQRHWQHLLSCSCWLNEACVGLAACAGVQVPAANRHMHRQKPWSELPAASSCCCRQPPLAARQVSKLQLPAALPAQIELPSGVRYTDLRIGGGQRPIKGYLVVVDYV